MSAVRAGRSGVQILHDVTLDIRIGETVALLGRNGMGKSTTLDCIAGVVKPSGGTLEVLGVSGGARRPNEVMARGLAYVPENRGIFPRLTVAENLRVSRKAGTRWTEERLLDLFPQLHQRLGIRAGHLSGGQQQMVAIARALSSDPAVLMLDEPSAGLAPLVIESIAEALRSIRRSGLTLLIVEQTMAVAAKLAERFVVMENGRVVGHATSAEIDDDPDFLERYLGVTRH